jgi:virginiamycin B lyase
MVTVAASVSRFVGCAAIVAGFVTGTATETAEPVLPARVSAAIFVRAVPLALVARDGARVAGAPEITEIGPTFRSPLVDVVARRDAVFGIEDDGVARVIDDEHVDERHAPCDRCSVVGAVPHGAGDGLAVAARDAVFAFADGRFSRVAWLRDLRTAHRVERGFARAYLDAAVATPEDVVLGIAGEPGIFGVSARGDVTVAAADRGSFDVLAGGSGVAWFGTGDGLATLSRAGFVGDRATTFLASNVVRPGGVVLRDGSLVAVAGPQLVRVARDGTATALAPLALAQSGRVDVGALAIDARDDVWYAALGATTVHRVASDGHDDALALPLPSGTAIGRMAFAADDSLWFVDVGGNALMQRLPDGRLRVVGNRLRPTSVPGAPVVTRDGAVWFRETLSWHPRIARIAPDGRVAEFPDFGNDVLRADGDDVDVVAPGAARATLSGVALSPDGRTRTIALPGCVATTVSVACGAPTARFAPGVFRLTGAAIGADGAMWFTDSVHSCIGRIAADGTVRVYTRGLTRWASGPQYLTAGPDGAMWFTEHRDRVGRVAMDGTIREFGGLPSRSFPGGIVRGRDGNLWFTLYHGNELVRLTTAGVMTRFRRGIFPSRGDDATIDAIPFPDAAGRIWFNEPQGGRIARATIPTR